MRIIFFTIVLFLGNLTTYSQELDFIAEDLTINENVDGTLLLPSDHGGLVLGIIIPGSGPTDRDGNQNFLKSNSLKKLAYGLARKNIATFRMDKRIVKQMKKGDFNTDISFDDFVDDVKAIVSYFSKSNEYDKIYLIGHSQGSLVGMLAINDEVDGFISLAGAGRSIDEVLIEQVDKTAPMFTDDTKRVLGILRDGKTTSSYPQALASIFNEEIQPFMMSWMKYNPTEIIATTSTPTLIINGTKDLQVTVEEAELLHHACAGSEIKIIENMNHVLFIIEGDDLENSKSYNEPNRKISEELVETIAHFIHQ